MEDRGKEVVYLKEEMDRVCKRSEELSYMNRQLERSVEFNRRFNEMSARMLAIEYIVRSCKYSIDKEALCAVLGITLPEEDKTDERITN